MDTINIVDRMNLFDLARRDIGFGWEYRKVNGQNGSMVPTEDNGRRPIRLGSAGMRLITIGSVDGRGRATRFITARA